MQVNTKLFHVYILTNRPRGVLYIGVTSDLATRLWQHRHGHFRGFTWRYNLHRLVYLEPHDDAEVAFKRERCMKEWKRQWKIDLIEQANPDWQELMPEGGLD